MCSMLHVWLSGWTNKPNQTKPNHGSADYLMVSPCGGTGVVTTQSLWNFGEQVATGVVLLPILWFSCVSFHQCTIFTDHSTINNNLQS